MLWKLASHVGAKELRGSIFAHKIFVALQMRKGRNSTAAFLAVKATAYWSAYIGLAAGQMILKHHLMRADRVHVTSANERDSSHLVSHGFLVEAGCVATWAGELHRADEELLVRATFAGVDSKPIHVVGLC